MFCFDWFLGYGLCGGYLMLQAIKVRWYGLAVTLSGVGNPTFGELLYMLSSRVLFMEAGGLYHDRHTAMLSTDHIRNIGKHCRIRKHRQRQCESAVCRLCTQVWGLVTSGGWREGKWRSGRARVVGGFLWGGRSDGESLHSGHR